MLLVDAVFVLFLVAQATAVFGGHDYVEDTTGLTYADYVHQGFGQLTHRHAAHAVRRLGGRAQGQGRTRSTGSGCGSRSACCAC